MKTASWILLTIVGSLTLLSSFASVGVAYFSEDDIIGGARGMNLSELAPDREDIAVALRARRGTAAAFGAGYAVLFLMLVLLPYRRGDAWAWWALLVAALTVTGITLLRIPTLDTTLGVGAAGALFGAVLLGLLLDVKRLKTSG